MSATGKTPDTLVTVKHPENQKGELKSVGGSMSDDWNNLLARQVVQSLSTKHLSPENLDRQRAGAVEALIGMAPQDELEGMAAAQLIAAHNAAMECHRRAMLENQTFEGRRENLNQANKLSRSFATLLDALNKHRGKGQQKVTVEHVHVHAGGQAVVGSVEAGGGGVNVRNEEQPHAKQIADAPEPEMWSSDAAREPMPLARNEEW